MHVQGRRKEGEVTLTCGVTLPAEGGSDVRAGLGLSPSGLRLCWAELSVGPRERGAWPREGRPRGLRSRSRGEMEWAIGLEPGRESFCHSILFFSFI